MKLSLGLVMICKDEAGVIAANLATIRPYISHWTVLDTGSSDGTQALVREALAGIPGDLYEEPFVDFGATRSRAFALARGTATFLLASDADMRWEIDEGWEPDADVDALMVAMGDSSFSWRLPLVLRGDLPWISIGAVHEYSVLADGDLGRRVPTDAFRVTYPDGSSREKTEWQLGLLEASLVSDPDNPRTLFYAAQSMRELGDPRARETYLRRAKMGGFAEEAWYAAYRAALLADWPGQAAELMAAWEMRPSRLEPLHALVQELNQRDQHHAAYQLSLIPALPTIDVVFVHKDVWAWGLMFERSIAAWWVGHVDEARLLGEELLTRDLPDHIRGAVLRNLAFTEPVAA